jgi:hypothetical protein
MQFLCRNRLLDSISCMTCFNSSVLEQRSFLSANSVPEVESSVRSSGLQMLRLAGRALISQTKEKPPSVLRLVAKGCRRRETHLRAT